MRLRWQLCLAIAAIVTFSSCSTELPKFLDEKWRHRSKLQIQNAGSAENLQNFPLLVKLNSSRIDYSLTNPNAADLRFYDADAKTPLDFEIERWDTSGDSYIWVRVPQIDANSNSDFIWMYYQNSDAASAANATAVWDSAFTGVWHFSNASSAAESTSNNFTGTPNLISAVDSPLGRGYSLNGTSSWINLGNNRIFLGGNSATTLSIWAYPAASVTASRSIISISIQNGGIPNSTSRATLTAVATNQFDVGGRAPDTVGVNQTQTSTTSPLKSGEWQLLTAVIDYASKNVTLYHNGVAIADNETVLAWPASVLDATASASAAIGSEDDGSSSFFAGRLDEVRIAKTGRSAAWILADYKSTTDAFVVYIKDY